MSKKICLDAGHYGKYNRSPVNSAYYESDFSWKFHLILKAALEKRGFQVITTRISQHSDLALEQRGRYAKGCDLFLSIHSNATSDSKADYSVACCLIDDKNTDIDDISIALGKKLADAVTNLMTGKSSGTTWQRAGAGGTDYYGVLRGAKYVGVPAILLEHGFHTNLSNTNFLLNSDNLQKMAEIEADIIAEFFGVKSSENNPDEQATFTPYLISVDSPDGFLNVRKTPSWEKSDIVKTIKNSNIKYTIVAETMLGNSKFGKLKSGAGWICVNDLYVKRYSK